MKQRKRVNNVCDMKIECKLKKSKYLNFQKPINLLNLFISLEKVKKIKLKLNPMTLPREHKGTTYLLLRSYKNQARGLHFKISNITSVSLALLPLTPERLHLILPTVKTFD